MNKQKKEVLPSFCLPFLPSFLHKYTRSPVPSTDPTLGLSSGPNRPPCPQGADDEQVNRLMAGGYKLDDAKAGQRERVTGGVTLEMVVREGPCKGVPFDKDLNGERRNIWAENIPVSWYSSCKGPERDCAGKSQKS